MASIKYRGRKLSLGKGGIYRTTIGGEKRKFYSFDEVDREIAQYNLRRRGVRGKNILRKIREGKKY